MERENLIKLVAEYANAYLLGDEHNPNLGIGMSIQTAIKYAEEDVLIEAKRWNRLEPLDFDDIRDEVKEIVIEKKKLR